VAEDLDAPGRRLREPGRAVDERRLARAVGAEQPEELALAMSSETPRSASVPVG
jgi:hypothetical protein